MWCLDIPGHQQDAQLLQQRLSQLMAQQSEAATWVAANPPSSQEQQQQPGELGPAQPGASSAASQATQGNKGGWAPGSGQQKHPQAAQQKQEAAWKWDILRPF